MKQMKIKGVGRLRVHLVRHAADHGCLRRIVKTKGTLSNGELAAEMGYDTETLNDIVEQIIRIVRAGYEVRMGTNENCVRFYPLLNRDCDEMVMVAQTCGDVRYSLGGVGFECYNGKDALDPEDVEAMNSEQAKKHSDVKYIAVTPDTVITCPKCGFDKIRVGKALSQKE